MGFRTRPADSDAALLPKEVGARLRQLRLEAGLTQSDVKRAVIVLVAEMELRGELD